jgi:hypothetical protein
MNIRPDPAVFLAIILGEIGDSCRDPAGENFTDLANLRIILQIAARDVEGQIRRVEAALLGEKYLSDDFRAVIGDKYLSS